MKRLAILALLAACVDTATPTPSGDHYVENITLHHVELVSDSTGRSITVPRGDLSGSLRVGDTVRPCDRATVDWCIRHDRRP